MDDAWPPAGITAAEWAATPPAVRALVQGALVALQIVQDRHAQLQDQVTHRQQRVTELEARLNQHSQNSSKPPSSDPPSAPPRPAPVPRGRKAGGQPGHPRHDRPDPDPDHIDQHCEHYPAVCSSCHDPLTHVQRDACAVQTQDVWELPVVRPAVTAHHYHTVCCPGCGTLVTANRPPDVPPGGTQRVPGPARRRRRDHPARRLSPQ